jgi:ribosomal protein S16
MAKTGRTVNESNRSLSRYLEEIGDFEPLNPDREVELAIKIKKSC